MPCHDGLCCVQLHCPDIKVPTHVCDFTESHSRRIVQPLLGIGRVRHDAWPRLGEQYPGGGVPANHLDLWRHDNVSGHGGLYHGVYCKLFNHFSSVEARHQHSHRVLVARLLRSLHQHGQPFIDHHHGQPSRRKHPCERLQDPCRHVRQKRHQLGNSPQLNAGRRHNYYQ